MAKLFQLSEASNLAIHALGYLGAKRNDGPASAAHIAKVLSVSENHLAKVLQRLVKFRLVRSVRGAKGGFMLARDPREVSLLEIVELMDGPLESSGCLLGKPVCKRGTCLFDDVLPQLEARLRARLAKTTLSHFRFDPA